MAALAAFGAPQMAPTLAAHNTRVEEIQRDKDAQIVQMQQAILGAQISQDMDTGKFNKALEHSKTMAMLKPITDAYEKKLALQDFTTKEEIRQKGRIALAQERGAQARAALTLRARELTKGLNIDDRILLAQINHISAMQNIALQRAAVYDPLSQTWTMNPTDMDAIQTSGNTLLEQWITEHHTPAITPGGTAGKTVAPIKAQTAAERIRAAATK